MTAVAVLPVNTPVTDATHVADVIDDGLILLWISPDEPDDILPDLVDLYIPARDQRNWTVEARDDAADDTCAHCLCRAGWGAYELVRVEASLLENFSADL